MTDEGGTPFLLFRVGAELAAIPVSEVSETLRPLPIDPVAGAPDFVAGVSVIRGVPTPVVDVARLMTGEKRSASRFVVVRVGGRRVALAVAEVAGVRRLTDAERLPLPPLFASREARGVGALGMLDSELFVVLETARIVPEAGALPVLPGGR